MVSLAVSMTTLDWFSRHLLTQRLSTTLETAFFTEALREALEHACPEIFNADQDVQLTSQEVTNIILNAVIGISMDASGRGYGNILSGVLWRTVEHEESCSYDYRAAFEASSLLAIFIVSRLDTEGRLNVG
ncbi:MAG: hypothetical protein E4H15_08070 [Syntrophobacterales bacterium]|nr:MAG: hypothetical protein E4H15_08070 [Syntrophobacterales bacterium]